MYIYKEYTIWYYLSFDLWRQKFYLSHSQSDTLKAVLDVASEKK
jgi:hypothetical protein